MKRREFLKGGTLLAACLVAGLKLTEPKPPTLVACGSDTHIGLYGGMAGAGKTPHPDDIWADFLTAIWTAHTERYQGRPDAFNFYPSQDFYGGGFLVSPQKMADLLEATGHLEVTC